MLFQYGMLVQSESSIATSGGTTSLINTSAQLQVFTGSSNQTLKLPDATTCSVGQFWEIYNTSSGNITVEFQDATSFAQFPIIYPNASLIVKLQSNGAANGTWVVLSTSGVGGLYNVGSTQSISSGGTVTLGSSSAQYIPVGGNGGAVNASTTPFASAPSNGTVITLEGTDNVDTVTFQNNDAANGMVLNGNATLGKYNTLTVVYRSAISRYVEICRS